MRKDNFTNIGELGDNDITMIINKDIDKKKIAVNKVAIESGKEMEIGIGIGINNPTFISEHLWFFLINEKFKL